MTTTKNILRGLVLLPLLVAGLAISPDSSTAAVITIVNNDAAGEGFNDPTPRAPVGGNPGMTLGEQRLFLFNYAASIWGNILPSNVVIQVRAQFNPQTCNATSAVLGSAGPVTIHRDFANAPFAGTWYHQALANRLAEVDLSANPDINATFNSNIDAGCFGPGLVWYYGTDGLEGPNIELLPVLLHEMGHGLGFSTTTSGTSGNYNNGSPSIYDYFLMDNTNNLHWNEMTPAQRVASAVGIDHLVWDGPVAIAAAGPYLSKRPRLVINAPAGIAGVYPAMAASFGPPLTAVGFTGNLVLGDDGAGDDFNDGCEPLINAGAIAGNIAVLNRGTCTFVLKALAAQAAGATGVIIINNVASGLPPMGGSDPTVTIPAIGVSQATGAAILANLPGVNVTMNLDPVLQAGADNNGRPLMYTPNPFAGGSSVSHWDVTLSPNALMEPAINNDLHDGVDLTTAHFTDIGWFQDPVAVQLEEFAARGREDGIQLRWRFSDPSEVAAVAVERALEAVGPWSRIEPVVGEEHGATTAFDASTDEGVEYYYRLSVTSDVGEVVALGMVSARREAAYAGRFFLGRPAPNPASLNGTMITFRLGRPEHVQLAVHDVSGRKVRMLEDGMMLEGAYTRHWDGILDRGSKAPAGVYFLNLRTSEGVKTQRVTIVR